MRERAALAALLLLAASACAHQQVGDRANGRGRACNLRPIQHDVGRVATHGRLKRMTRISRATDIRVLRADLRHGAEVKPTRLSVTIDAGNRITALACS